MIPQHVCPAATLNTGAKIPAVGFGTFQHPGAQEGAVSKAREYHVEKQVVRGTKASGIPREGIFLSTKLWCTGYHPDDMETERPRHPLQMQVVNDSWGAVERLSKGERVKAIGVSNFSKGELEFLIKEFNTVSRRMTDWSKEVSRMAKVIDRPMLKEIARKYSKSAVQVILAWFINNGHSVIIKSIINWQIKENVEPDFLPEPNGMEKIAILGRY
ncbi:putative aldehyde reductase [Rostrohypoxylon terebratum]|nr:putative aldehyde reductase [Rostrohypoxylon terebratum]